MRLSILLLLISLFPAQSFAQLAVRPDANINSQCEEREPIPSADGNTVYFWRRECPENSGGYNDPGDIWMSEKQRDGSWSRAIRLGSPLNSKGHDFIWQVSTGHDSLFLMQAAPGVQEPGISYATRMSGKNRWTAPVQMNIRQFRYEGTYKDYFKAPGNILLLPNKGYPSFGGTDLYVCFPINDTAWSKPINLGPDVNSSGNEDAPYVSPDGKALYFNSDGRSQNGDHNIYVSYRLDESWQRWTQPVPLPAPINGPGYDFDFQMSADGSVAWWCSDLGTLGSNDIFYLNLNQCEVNIYPLEELTYCLGESVILEAGFTPDPQATYQWFKNGSPIRGAFQSRPRVDTNGEYEVLRSGATCEARSNSRQVRFVPAPQPLIRAGGDVICLEDSLMLQAESAAASSFRWFKNGLEIPQASSRNFWVKNPGSYEVEVALGNCATRSPAYDILTFNPPVIFTEEDTMEGWMPILPKWQWTNTVRPDKGETHVRDITAGPGGEIYVLSQTKFKSRVSQRVTSFFPNGLERGITYDNPIENIGDGFLTTDPDGNLILAGEGEYLRKFKPDGRAMWWKDQAGLELMGLCVDPLGNIYTAGRFKETVQIGQKILNAPDRGGVFLAKHSPRGELLWAKSYGVDYYTFDFGNALASDCEGNIYLAGGFDLVADFGRYPLRGTLLKENYFLVKFNPDGNIQYSRKINTERTRVRSGDLTVECNGKVALLLNREYYLFAPNGIDLWSGPLKMPEGTYALSHRTVGFQGDLYTTGFTIDGRSFVSKLNRLYNQVILWQDRGASTTEDDLPAITSDSRGGITVSGVSDGNNFQGAQFDLTSGSPVFVMKYDKPLVQVIEREPLSLCGDKPVVLLIRDEPGLEYQWTRNGKIISGATQAAYRASREGTYQVIATVSGCQRISDPVMVSDCGEEPTLQPVVIANSTPPAEPNQTPAFPQETDVDYGISGSPSRLKGRRVKSQDEVTIGSTQATIMVWDHGAVDLDTVSINLNGEWILENYGLQKSAYQIQVNLQPGDNYLMLYAHNLGTTPPNTASIKIDDGITKKTLQLRSSLRNCGMLRIYVE